MSFRLVRSPHPNIPSISLLYITLAAPYRSVLQGLLVSWSKNLEELNHCSIFSDDRLRLPLVMRCAYGEIQQLGEQYRLSSASNFYWQHVEMRTNHCIADASFVCMESRKHKFREGHLRRRCQVHVKIGKILVEAYSRTSLRCASSWACC